MIKEPNIDMENYNSYFDALRNSSFEYPVSEAGELIENPGLKSKPSKSSTIKKMIIMTTISAIIVSGYLWVMPGKQLQTDVHKGDDPKTLKQTTALKTITDPKAVITLDTGKVKGLPLLPTLPGDPKSPATPTTTTLLSEPLPHVPKPPVVPQLPKFEIPDMKEWAACYSVLKVETPQELPQMPAIPNLEPIKPIVLNEKDYPKLGIYKTSTGTFIDLGCIAYCCNRHATFIKPFALGTLTGPLPTLITDENGKNFRVYAFSEEKQKAMKEQLIANGASKNNVDEMATADILKASMNSLVPVLVKNDADTSHGNMHNNIILWYNGDDNMFTARLSEALKDRMIKPGQCDVKLDVKDNVAMGRFELKPNIASRPNTGVCTWTDFKIYPNPISDNFTLYFKLTDDKKLKVNLYDITGRLVKMLQPETSYAKGPYSNSFNIGGLTEGIYILAVQSADGETWTQRVIRK
jgi:hypothetical protein